MNRAGVIANGQVGPANGPDVIAGRADGPASKAGVIASGTDGSGRGSDGSGSESDDSGRGSDGRGSGADVVGGRTDGHASRAGVIASGADASASGAGVHGGETDVIKGESGGHGGGAVVVVSGAVVVVSGAVGPVSGAVGVPLRAALPALAPAVLEPRGASRGLGTVPFEGAGAHPEGGGVLPGRSTDRGGLALRGPAAVAAAAVFREHVQRSEGVAAEAVLLATETLGLGPERRMVLGEAVGALAVLVHALAGLAYVGASQFSALTKCLAARPPVLMRLSLKAKASGAPPGLEEGDTLQ